MRKMDTDTLREKYEAGNIEDPYGIIHTITAERVRIEDMTDYFRDVKNREWYDSEGGEPWSTAITDALRFGKIILRIADRTGNYDFGLVFRGGNRNLHYGVPNSDLDNAEKGAEQACDYLLDVLKEKSESK